MRVAIKVFLATAMFAGAIAQTTAQQEPDNALQIKLVRIPRRSLRPFFQVGLHNAGERPLILNLGVMLANGKEQYVEAIQLLLKDNRGNTTPLDVLEPPILGGRVDRFVLPLPKGSTFTLPIDLSDYMSPNGSSWQVTLVPGRYELSARYDGVGIPKRGANSDMQGQSLMPFWIGTARSNAVAFKLSQTVSYPHTK